MKDEKAADGGAIEKEQMDELLVELRNTGMWPAVLEYMRLRDSEIISAIVGSDPFKDPTGLSRAQGMRLGLYDLKQYVESLKGSSAGDGE